MTYYALEVAGSVPVAVISGVFSGVAIVDSWAKFSTLYSVAPARMQAVDLCQRQLIGWYFD